MTAPSQNAHPHSFGLHAGALRLALRPDLGGAIAGLWHHETPILRSTEPAALLTSRQSASYPLVPYSNRLGNRRFRWAGRDYTTATNFDDNPHSVHGVAWQRSWEVVSSCADSVVLRYRHVADAHWPFPFEVHQHFSLSPQRLDLQLVFTNTADSSQPVGLGWHPYFVKRERSHLHAELTARWESDVTQLPTHKEMQPGIDGDVVDMSFDHCFEGWGGAAEIDDEKFSLRLTSSLGYLVVYTPNDQGYFCVEPVSHVSNAIQMDDPAVHGLRTVGPGESFDASMAIEVTAL